MPIIQIIFCATPIADDEDSLGEHEVVSSASLGPPICGSPFLKHRRPSVTNLLGRMACRMIADFKRNLLLTRHA